MEGPPHPPETPGKLDPGDSSTYMYSGFNDHHWKEAIPPKMEPPMSDNEKEVEINTNDSICGCNSTENTVGAYGAEVPSVVSNNPLKPPEQQTVLPAEAIWYKEKENIIEHNECIIKHNEWVSKYYECLADYNETSSTYRMCNNMLRHCVQYYLDNIDLCSKSTETPEVQSQFLWSEYMEDQWRAIAKARIELQEWSTRMEASAFAWHEVQAVRLHQQYLAEEAWYSYHYNNNCSENGQANTNKSTHDDEEASGNDATTPDNTEEMMPSSTEAIGMLGCDYYQDDMCHTTMPTACLPPTVQWRGGTTKTTTPKKAVRKKGCGNVKAVNPKKVIRKKSDRPNTETPTSTTTRPPQWFINIVLQQIVASMRVPTPVPPPPTTTTTTTTTMCWKGGSDKFVIPKKSV
jgi:hypothetical protein